MNDINFYPEYEDVFYGNIESCKKYFYPLATIDLSIISKRLSGLVHIVYFNNDPYCNNSIRCYTGDYNIDLISFKLIDNKLQFTGDFAFFDTNENWMDYLEMDRKLYCERKEKLKNGLLDFSIVIKDLDLGKRPRYFIKNKWPINKLGEKLKFLCYIYSGDFIGVGRCDKDIFAFYDNNEKEIVVISIGG